jgi:hypothetical protein
MVMDGSYRRATTFRTHWHAVLFLLPAVLIPASTAIPASPPDLSTPASALAAFTKALAEGDAATIATTSTGDAKSQAWASALAAQLHAFKELEAALTKRFGKDYNTGDVSKDLREQIEAARDNDLHTDLKQAKLGKPDGDTVLIILDESASADRQGRLVRSAGAWKVDVGSFSDYFSPEDTAGLKATAAAATGLAREVTEGKFASLEDAATAVDERLAAAEEAAEAKPAPSPTVKPAAATPSPRKP